MYEAKQTAVDQRIRYSLHEDGANLSVRDVLTRWINDAAFRLFFNHLLADAPFSAFRWETPAVTTALMEKPFQFVLLNSPSLERQADPAAFAEHIREAEWVVAFSNLRGDASLVVPCAREGNERFGHLAAFTRSAPADQCDALWSVVGNAMLQSIGDQPVWLSTAGMGVPWLHVRLDSRPKYYGYQPYRDPSFLKSN